MNACGQNHSNGVTIPSKECIELNNKGVDYLMKFPRSEKDIDTAINFFNQAIKCNATYLTAYINLSNAYDSNKNYSKELAVYDKALILCSNRLVLLTNKAVIFEKMNLPDSANKIYQLARRGFTDSLTIHPTNINFINGFIQLIALTEGKEAALKELDRQTSLHPELKPKMASEYFFYQNFDKKAFIYHLTQ
jgi:tetratricopeptide (TPR) repeat protein